MNIARNEIKYHVDVELDLREIPKVSCVPSEVNQVIMNLVVNAAQAIEEKGKVTLKTCREDEGVVLLVQDDGCGIPEKNLNKIFDPFFTTKPVGTGTGLGLSLSYSMVENNGGTLEVESEVGVGTCFKLRFPLG